MSRKKSNTFDRRRFLMGSLGAGALTFGAPSFLGQLAQAQEQALGSPQRHYIFCYFGGGWDTLLSLDPRDPREFTNDTASLARTRIQPGYGTLARADADIIRHNQDLAFGPYIGDLINHVDKFAVIRGMNGETVAHATGRRRFLTGKPPSGTLARGSSGSTWLASQLGSDELIPNLSVRVESYNKELPNYATAMRVSSIEDLLRVLRPAEPSVPELLRRQVSLALSDAANCPRAEKSRRWNVAEFSRLRGRSMVNENIGDLFNLDARNDQMARIRDHYGFARADNGAEATAALAVQAITQGVSRCVTVGLVGGLDAHDGRNWTDLHGPRQERGFNAIARMIEDLGSRDYGDGSTWLDHTYIIGFSEFSRTPLLNSSGGRDHHITNSCLVAGGRTRGGQIIGATSDVAMQSVPTNIVTGRPDPGGVILKPEHVLRTLFDEVGIGEAPDLRVDGLSCLLRS